MQHAANRNNNNRNHRPRGDQINGPQDPPIIPAPRGYFKTKLGKITSFKLSGECNKELVQQLENRYGPPRSVNGETWTVVNNGFGKHGHTNSRNIRSYHRHMATQMWASGRRLFGVGEYPTAHYYHQREVIGANGQRELVNIVDGELHCQIPKVCAKDYARHGQIPREVGRNLPSMCECASGGYVTVVDNVPTYKRQCNVCEAFWTDDRRPLSIETFYYKGVKDTFLRKLGLGILAFNDGMSAIRSGNSSGELLDNEGSYKMYVEKDKLMMDFSVHGNGEMYRHEVVNTLPGDGWYWKDQVLVPVGPTNDGAEMKIVTRYVFCEVKSRLMNGPMPHILVETNTLSEEQVRAMYPTDKDILTPLAGPCFTDIKREGSALHPIEVALMSDIDVMNTALLDIQPETKDLLSTEQLREITADTLLMDFTRRRAETVKYPFVNKIIRQFKNLTNATIHTTKQSGIEFMHYTVFEKNMLGLQTIEHQAYAPSQLVDDLYHVITVKESSKSIEQAIKNYQKVHNDYSSACVIDAGIIAEFIIRCERQRLETFRNLVKISSDLK